MAYLIKVGEKYLMATSVKLSPDVEERVHQDLGHVYLTYDLRANLDLDD